jgi:oxepin-CoA hydrolase/3-oxo-5,6-dehydrosuberyl-CoA semialdehyde dehydrogenase
MTTPLKSYLSGGWATGSANPATLVNPSTEEALATASTAGLDFGAAVRFAREKGGPALRELTFAQRAEILRKLAKAVADAREELITIGIANAGNTRSDAKFDIDGAAGTLNFYADLGLKLGDAKLLPDGEGVPMGRSARLYGQHVLVPRVGVAVHINAFNFPAWGMGEKIAVSLLAGVPTISKPATSTAMMAARIAELWVGTGALPPGAFSFVGGSAGDLLSHLGPQDVLAFTGSSDTALTLRSQQNLLKDSVHVNVEADSLNSALLGPDASSGSETWNMFVTDVVKEMTQKTGQKCTATRRIYVPAERLDEAREALVERLKDVKIGNPADEKNTMGPVATAQQLRDVRAGIEKIAAGAEVACGGAKPVDGLAKGFFVAPTLLVRKGPKADDVTNRHEVFGPVATLMPYGSVRELVGLVAAGGGGLVSSVYSDDKGYLTEALSGIAPWFGRVTISNEKVAGQTIPPGTVMPSMLHGGPGRAGGGEELGGQRGLSLYLQRVALQGPRPFVEAFAGVKSAQP